MSQAIDTGGDGPHDALFRSIPHVFDPPEDFPMSTSWERAQSEHDRGGPINDAERMVWLEGGEKPHRVVFALSGGTLRCKCSCKGFQYNGEWCAHVASCWWRWVRARIEVTHLETGRVYARPPGWLRIGHDADDDLDELTPKQLDAWLHCEYGDYGVREFARDTGRAPGTIGNHLRWSRETLEGSRA